MSDLDLHAWPQVCEKAKAFMILTNYLTRFCIDVNGRLYVAKICWSDKPDTHYISD